MSNTIFNTMNPTAWFWKEYAIQNDYEQHEQDARCWAHDDPTNYPTLWVPDESMGLADAQAFYDHNVSVISQTDGDSKELVREWVWEYVEITLSDDLPADWDKQEKYKEFGYGSMYDAQRNLNGIYNFKLSYSTDGRQAIYHNQAGMEFTTPNRMETYGDLALRIAFLDNYRHWQNEQQVGPQVTATPSETPNNAPNNTPRLMDIEQEPSESLSLWRYYGYMSAQDYVDQRLALQKKINNK